MATRGHQKDVWGQTLKSCRQFPGRQMIDLSPCFHWMTLALLHAHLKPSSFGYMSYVIHIIQGTDVLLLSGSNCDTKQSANQAWLSSDVVYGKSTMHLRQHCIRNFLFPYYLERCDFDSWLITEMCFHLLFRAQKMSLIELLKKMFEMSLIELLRQTGMRADLMQILVSARFYIKCFFFFI